MIRVVEFGKSGFCCNYELLEDACASRKCECSIARDGIVHVFYRDLVSSYIHISFSTYLSRPSRSS
jgi:hypothetical protein